MSKDAYTACAIDVAVGQKDLCLGHFWITSDRALHTTFLPPVTSDEFFFVMPKNGTFSNALLPVHFVCTCMRCLLASCTVHVEVSLLKMGSVNFWLSFQGG